MYYVAYTDVSVFLVCLLLMFVLCFLIQLTVFVVVVLRTGGQGDYWEVKPGGRSTNN